MLTAFLPKSAASRRISLILAALIVPAWGLLFAWQRSPYAELQGHEALADHHIPFTVHLAVFLLSWLLMTVAMMLPVSLPAIIDTRSNRAPGFWAAAAAVLGYLSPWVLFGLLAFLGDNALHAITEHGRPLEMAAGFIAPSILLAAGVYQFTPFKRSFIERCRPAKRIEAPEDRERMGKTFSRGLRLGWFCVGSCGLLMLLMFALGHHRLEWMLVISGIVGAERLAPWGHRVAWFVGLALIVWAAGSVIAVI